MLRTAIVIPTQVEAEVYFKKWKFELAEESPWQIYQTQLPGQTVSLIVSFIGPANAAAATERLICRGTDRILNSGSAGAINSDLLPGDIVIGESYKILCDRATLEVRKSLLLSSSPIRFIKDGKPTFLGELKADEVLLAGAQELMANPQNAQPIQEPWRGPWPEDEPRRPCRVSTGAVGSIDGWTKGLENLDFVRNTFSVDVEDMESAFIAQIAAIHGLPYLAVRAISNNEYRRTLAKDEIIPAVQEAAARAAAVVIQTVESFTHPSAGQTDG